MIKPKECLIMEKESVNPIKNFQDLEVYQNSYKASINVIKEIIPKLPKEEQSDLASQLRRSCKTIFIDIELCDELLDLYDKTSRQLYNLSLAWKAFKEKHKQ
jgi:hypothetical protein